MPTKILKNLFQFLKNIFQLLR